MPRKKRKPEETVARLRQVDVAAAHGVPLTEAIVAPATRHGRCGCRRITALLLFCARRAGW
jgi:hypothetical protein